MLRRTFLVSMVALLANRSALAQGHSPILCWGDSLTAGNGVIDEQNHSYPGVLQSLVPDRLALRYGFPGETSAQIVERFRRFPMTLAPDPVLALWVGKNDYDPKLTLSSVEAALGNQFIDRGKSIVMGIIPDAGENWTGARSIVARTNRALRDAFPAQYLEIAGPLVEASMGGKTLAKGWTVDDRHLTEQGYAFVADLVASAIFRRGL